MENHRASASAPILGKFRALVRDEGDVVGAYEELLSELTFNSKPIITELTIIAGDQKEHGEGIAHAICSRILEVPVDQKLPSLYLLDSIVKNIGCEYVRYFASQLPKVFCEAYNQVQSSLHPSMRHLFGTWSKVFHPSVLRKIEDELQISTTENQRSAALAKTRNTESASPRPSHGIHVNPKYLEARRQLESSAAMGTMDAQKDAGATEFEDDAVDTLAAESPKGWSGAFPKVHGVGQATGSSSSIHGYRQKSKSPLQYDDYERPKVLPPHLGISKTGSPYTTTVRASAMDGDEDPMHLVKVEVSNHLSPRLRQRSASPLDDNFPRGSSSWRPAEIASSPNSRLGFVPSRSAIDQNGWMERHLSSNVGVRQKEASTAYDCNNGYRKKHLRELIDAYGNYRGLSTSLEKPPKVQRIDVNGMDKEVVTKNWRSSEEEEYVWEDMSPTLANQSRRNSLPLGPDLGSLSRRVALGRPDATILEPDCNRNTWSGQTKLHPVDDPAIIVDDRPVLGSVHGSMNKKFQDGAGSSFRHYHRVREPEKFPYSYQQGLNSRSQGWGAPEPFASSSVTLPNGQKVPGPYEYSPDVEIPFQRFSSIHSDSSNVEASPIDKHMTIRPPSPPSGPAIWPPVHKSQASHLLPIPPNQKHLNSPFSFMEVNKPMVNQGPNSSVFLPQQQFDPADRKFSSKVIPLPHELPGIIQKNQHTQEQCIGMAVQSQEAHEGYVPPVPPAQFSSQTSARPLEHIPMQGQGLVKGSVLANSLPAMATSIATQNVPDASWIQHGGILPPLPPGPPPLSSQIEPTSECSGSIISSSPSSAFSGLISTLMAQGLISLTPPTQSEGSVGTDFNAELLKVRHESVINALYANLPRQCTTCGLRFTCQEEHRNHMDWHVTKNRISKNRKQKPSRKWFVNAKEWLSGTETVGTDVVPGFLPTETATEKKEEKEMAVPADENQIVCALCGEPFEDFYSDETEEWMYKGAVYLNAVDGHIEGLDRSHLGPIVHEKCRPGSFEGS
ncbi:uncharacterized protein M6B38_173465 [Iris pallida]|uniref:CID domain-containing protein n=1 Tax=Iris pallida TaxID=29817 RepID=A0AAX6ESP9_IRIPA|nr:uncharacterized protein M6B38_173465 [Iris pallida]